MYNHVAKTKAQISCAVTVTAQLICPFVFSYAKILVLSHNHWPNLIVEKVVIDKHTYSAGQKQNNQ